MKQVIDKIKLQMELARMQRLYAQMLKDKINQGPALQELHQQINNLTIQLYANPSLRQRI